MNDFALLCSLLGISLNASVMRKEDGLKKLIGALCAAGLFVCAIVTWAEPVSGVVGTLIGRGI
jgi:hypothetical protein